MTKLTIEMERALEHRCPQLVDLLKNVEGRIEVEHLLSVYEGEQPERLTDETRDTLESKNFRSGYLDGFDDARKKVPSRF